MIMQRAARIKSGFAIWTARSVQIFVYRKFLLAAAAKDRCCIKFFPFPYANWMVFRFIVAQIARIIFIAAAKSNRNDIAFAMIMFASRFIIDHFSVHDLLSNSFHSFTSNQKNCSIHLFNYDRISFNLSSGKGHEAVFFTQINRFIYAIIK